MAAHPHTTGPRSRPALFFIIILNFLLTNMVAPRVFEQTPKTSWSENLYIVLSQWKGGVLTLRFRVEFSFLFLFLHFVIRLFKSIFWDNEGYVIHTRLREGGRDGSSPFIRLVFVVSAFFFSFNCSLFLFLYLPYSLVLHILHQLLWRSATSMSK